MSRNIFVLVMIVLALTLPALAMAQDGPRLYVPLVFKDKQMLGFTVTQLVEAEENVQYPYEFWPEVITCYELPGVDPEKVLLFESCWRWWKYDANQNPDTAAIYNFTWDANNNKVQADLIFQSAEVNP